MFNLYLPCHYSSVDYAQDIVACAGFVESTIVEYADNCTRVIVAGDFNYSLLHLVSQNNLLALSDMFSYLNLISVDYLCKGNVHYTFRNDTRVVTWIDHFLSQVSLCYSINFLFKLFECILEPCIIKYLCGEENQLAFVKGGGCNKAVFCCGVFLFA